ncbi:hypothetical protein Phum_PHUM087310 [Pediculus humanus corporis]|uniref:Uncharacterized protein n=1 Tax=Pediculus humanus subsp. corporis TaxID=121224 RepID=E0VCI2_PEDHC|nr:uncharacterized protein Phum_PHUM087310 [Pediculus humanus corporis]EEB11088.1 hypothetical protein Phum_PHUM087310 [Pediculus humanus corporis]
MTQWWCIKLCSTALNSPSDNTEKAYFEGVKLDTGDIPALSSGSRAIVEIAEELSKAISESSYLPSLPCSNVALIIRNWINQNSGVSE